MFYLACTKFNNATYKENMAYRMKHNESVIYGPSYKIRDIYSIGSLIFVVEMNNETNKIMGIGLIKNSLVSDKRHKIYENGEYNRYIYRGTYWIGRENLLTIDSEIVEIFDNILFKGKSHMKRTAGITILTEKLFTNWIYELTLLKNKVKTAFLNYFIKYNKMDNDVYLEKEKEDEEEDIKELELELEVIEIVPKKRRKNNKEIKI